MNLRQHLNLQVNAVGKGVIIASVLVGLAVVAKLSPEPELGRRPDTLTAQENRAIKGLAECERYWLNGPGQFNPRSRQSLDVLCPVPEILRGK